MPETCFLNFQFCIKYYLFRCCTVPYVADLLQILISMNVIKPSWPSCFDVANNYRPQTKFAKVMFSQVSVCPQGGCLPHYMLGYTSPPGPVADTPLGADTPQSRHPTGADPPQWMLGDTGSKRAVRMLLECILVLDLFWTVPTEMCQFNINTKKSQNLLECA